jgi:hypothetical protein
VKGTDLRCQPHPSHISWQAFPFNRNAARLPLVNSTPAASKPVGTGALTLKFGFGIKLAE